MKSDFRKTHFSRCSIAFLFSPLSCTGLISLNKTFHNFKTTETVVRNSLAAWNLLIDAFAGPKILESWVRLLSERDVSKKNTWYQSQKYGVYDIAPFYAGISAGFTHAALKWDLDVLQYRSRFGIGIPYTWQKKWKCVLCPDDPEFLSYTVHFFIPDLSFQSFGATIGHWINFVLYRNGWLLGAFLRKKIII